MAGFDISALESVASQHSLELATKAVAGAATAKLLMDNNAVQVGLKGTADISILDSDINIQDASTCGARNPLGNVVLSNKRITAVSMKDQTNLCPKALYNTYFASVIAKGQDPAGESMDASFIKSIIDLRTKKIASANEVMIWNGDTGGTDLIDGFLTQLEASYGWADTTASGADIIAKLQSVYNQSDVTVRHQDDFRMFMGQDTFDTYITALTGKNLFNPQGADVTILGTMGKIFVAPGLNGTNKVVTGRISDFRLGLDWIGDTDKVTLQYSVETGFWYLDVYWSLGVAIVFPSEVRVSTVA